MFYSDGIQKEFVDILDNKGINFEIDNDGAVWYRVSDAEVVDNIIADIFFRYFRKNRIMYTSARYTNLFIKRLEEAIIPYKVVIIDGAKWVYWEDRYDSKVRAIMKDVEKTMRNIRREERIRIHGSPR